MNGGPQERTVPAISTSAHYGTADTLFGSKDSYGNPEIPVTIEKNERMTPDTHWQDVRHLVLTSKSKVDYQPGDVLKIHPKNSSDDVDQMLTQMNWNEIAGQPIFLTPNNPRLGSPVQSPPPMSLPAPTTTLRELLTCHFDLTAIPGRSFFASIAHFTQDGFHKERLLDFTKPDYLDELYDYTTRPRRSILEVLQEFDSVKIPWQWAASILPELRGRQFSIASGGRLKKSADNSARFELLVAIVKYKTVIKKIRQGVCTRYIAEVKTGTELRVSLQKGSLAMDGDEVKRPIILIGPGTGIAPLRSLLWERLRWSQDQILDGQVHEFSKSASNLLFFGCRNEASDYFFRDEWESLKEKMSLNVHAAFSRDQKAKVYVQDIVREHHKSVYHLLQQNCMVYVCGSSGKMPQAVRGALLDVLTMNGFEQTAAGSFLARMEKDGRYKQETWS